MQHGVDAVPVRDPRHGLGQCAVVAEIGEQQFLGDLPDTRCGVRLKPRGIPYRPDAAP
ncbi:hypothetical protein [Streptomyces triticiradicis]|uniref:hypothetical protein n=1 Tax=Streptomyces triticiradicis TaxID=2651189 RepID=UPI001788D8EE|nr:hypothetical protein [Streptomyces triticiradicis]